ncbi:isochorismate synthase [Bacillus tianshenii]|nr:isochorismate synthase [Bacillus tianshenii]
MVAIQQELVTEQLALGVQKAKEQSRDILVSMVKKLDDCSPLAVFAAARALNIKERIYWAEPNSVLQMAAIGAVKTVEAVTEDRYTEVAYKWQEIVKHAVIAPDNGPQGTGPMLLGGFAFDENKNTNPMLWKQFSNTKFVLPQFIVSRTQEQTWLTVNVVVNEEDNIDGKADELVKLENEMFSAIHSVSSAGQNKFTFVEEKAKEEWLEAVDDLAREIRDRLYEKVVLARELRIGMDKALLAEQVLKRLKHEQPTSYIFAFQFEDDCFLGASPERLVRRENEEFLSTCLAGSIERGATAQEDQQLGQVLLDDRKNLHEHQIVVDMIRSAMELCCNEVDIPEKPVLYKARDIQHLYTPVVGRAKGNVSLLSVVGHLHPTPALGGYPRKVALEKIREHEALERGWYAAPIGWIDYQGNGEFAVAIRSGLLQGKEVSLFAGCGIVGDSTPESEYNETNVKFRPMLSAIGGRINVPE